MWHVRRRTQRPSDFADSAPNNHVNAPELLAAAEKYNTARRKVVCAVEMATDVLLQAEMYNASQLLDTAIHWIVKHAQQVLETEAWKGKDHPKLVDETCKQLACYVKEIKGNASDDAKNKFPASASKKYGWGENFFCFWLTPSLEKTYFPYIIIIIIALSKILAQFVFCFQSFTVCSWSVMLQWLC